MDSNLDSLYHICDDLDLDLTGISMDSSTEFRRNVLDLGCSMHDGICVKQRHLEMSCYGNLTVLTIIIYDNNSIHVIYPQSPSMVPLIVL